MKPLEPLKLSLGLLACLLFVASVGEAQTAAARFETTYQSAANYTGSIFGLSSDVRVGDSTLLLPHLSRLTRNFNQGPSFEETGFGVGLSQKLTSNIYVLSDMNVVPNALILAKTQAAVEPHYAFGNHDFGFRAGGNFYNDLNAAVIAPSYIYSLNDDTSISESVTAVRSDRWSIASTTQFVTKPFSGTRLRVAPAFGEALEAEGLAASFKSLAAEFSVDVYRNVRVGIGATQYESTLRKESSFLLRLEAL